MILDTAKNYAIGILFGLTVVGGIASYVLYQRADKLAAQVQPLRDAAREATDIAETNRLALVRCEGEKKAMREANERAIRDAREDADRAEADAEEYRKRLTNPPADCEATLRAVVCPALRDY